MYFASMKTFKTLSADLQLLKFESFLSNLSEDEYGNIVLNIEIAGNKQTLTLNVSSRPIRRKRRPEEQEKGKVEEITDKANSLKDEIIANLRENVSDQCQEGTLVEYASAFDLHRSSLDLDQRIEYIEQLASIFCEPSYVHHVDEEQDFWADYDYVSLPI